MGGQSLWFPCPKDMWLDASYGDVRGDGASKRSKTGTEMGKGEVGRGELRSGKCLDAWFTRPQHRTVPWQATQSGTRKTDHQPLWQQLQPGAHLFPLDLDSIRHSEKAGKKTAKNKKKRRVLLWWGAETRR